MYLEHLTINGFKSFANKTVLDFRPTKNKDYIGITAIVGPNGSGKSNVVDAIRWVLGEQSAKQLRGKKSGDVIFAGSEKKPRSSSAQVSLKLNNEDNKLDIGYSEAELSRQLFRNGDSGYSINNNKSRLQDINYLLAKANIGQKSYTVIGQGTIDTVLNATPTERKDFFDEAAGIKQYQIKKDQAVNKLNLAEENLSQGVIQLAEITPRLKSLNRLMKRLEEREEVLEKLNTKLIQFYSKLWNNLTSSLETQLNAKIETTKERDVVQSELDDLQEQMKKLAENSAEDAEYTNLQKNYDELLQKQRILSQKRAQWQGRLDSNWAQNGQQNLAFLDQQARSLELEIKNQKTTLTNLYEKIKSTTNRQQNLQKEYKILTNKIGKLQEKLFARLEPNQTLKGDAVQTIKENIEGLLSAIDNTLTTASKNNQTLAEVQKSLDNIVEDIRHQLDQIPTHEDSVNVTSWQEQLQSLEKEKTNFDKKLIDTNATLQSLQQNVENITNNIKFKESELQSILDEKKPLENSSTDNNDSDKIKKMLSDLDSELELLEKNILNTKTKLESINESEQAKKQQLFDIQQKSSTLQNNLNTINQQLTKYEIELARLQTRLEDLKNNAEHDFGQSFSLIETQLKENKDHTEFSISELEMDIEKLKTKKELIGNIDDETKKEHAEITERHEWLNTQITDLETAITSLRDVIDDLDKKIEKQFNDNIKKINEKFSHYFSILFNGGKSELKIITSETIDNEDEDKGENKNNTKTTKSKQKAITGVDIVATPPGKRLQSITMLSGGEKALTSIALICAIIANNASPFVVLDEVDAALDEANSNRFANILEELSKKTQFIVITHNRATMEKAQLLYGVTMGDDSVSKLISIKLEEGKQFANR